MNRLDHDHVFVHMDADAGQVYDLVSDVARTPEWSPEVISCSWLDGATGAAEGARFVARNRRRWFTWSNRPVVTTARWGEEFAFIRTEHGGGTIRWYFRIRPDETGIRLELGYQVLRSVPVGLHIVLRALFGVRDLRADLHDNMRHSLQRIAQLGRRHDSPASSSS